MKPESSRPALAIALFALTFLAWAYAIAVSGGNDAPNVEHTSRVPTTPAEPLEPLEPAFEAPDVPAGQPLIDVYLRVAPARGEEAAARLQRMDVHALNATGGSPAAGLARSQHVAEQSEGRLRPLCGIPVVGLDRPGADARLRDEVSACRDQGAAGVFVSSSVGLGVRRPDRSLLTVDDPLLDPLFERAAELGFPIVLEAPPSPAHFAPLEGNPLRALLERQPALHHHGAMPDESRPWPTWEELFARIAARVGQHPGPIVVVAPPGTPRPSLEALLATPSCVLGVDPRDTNLRALFSAFPGRVLVASGASVSADRVRDGHEEGWRNPDALFPVYAAIREALTSGDDAGLDEANRAARSLFSFP
ncbi:MAG: hypothetical protein KF901_25780 [Myxococcales bacterium]|nr:hypothetical protein [Myxococcales bacterium]